ncbi:OsmC family protein [Adhaeribacter radiodurans]|uniref:OsmC family protein n=1 Tax=Adhaeribacter radiodurans TaxID=2745197 RepID=A0A7L7L2V6_9BACT|nr:OsmC family protein [Adhaeribacter radiodurans]QMU26779.1 OsmC family protein [Adhaeribacter radiodurans]
MKVELKRVDNAFHFEAVGAAGVPVNIDANPEVGGNNAGARPMEMILMGLGGCSAIDITLILKKQKQEITDFRIHIDGDREPNATPAVFTNIRIHYALSGNLDEQKVKRAIDLSMDKYCSVTAILNKTAQISYTFSINAVSVEV